MTFKKSFLVILYTSTDPKLITLLVLGKPVKNDTSPNV